MLLFENGYFQQYKSISQIIIGVQSVKISSLLNWLLIMAGFDISTYPNYFLTLLMLFKYCTSNKTFTVFIIMLAGIAFNKLPYNYC